MFANCQLMGIDIAFPDVCKSPVVPIPWPNFALGCIAIPKAWNILCLCTPTHNLATITPLTNGDNAGVGLGVVMQKVMSESRHTTGAYSVRIKTSPLSRVISLTRQNGGNTFGMRIVPSQPKVLVLAA
jgi:hypothetical protein